MKTNTALIWLCALVALFALITSAAGVFWQDNGKPYRVTTPFGETVELYGNGIYRNDSVFRAPALRGNDTVTLFVFLPLFIGCMVYYRRSPLRGTLLLSGMLAYFLYNAASLSLGAAYNNLFLVYVAYFSSCLFAFITALTSVDLRALPRHISPRMPHRGMGIFLFFAGLSVFVWLIEIISGLVSGTRPPLLEYYTTHVTGVLDVGIIAPTAYFAGVMMLLRKPAGLLLGIVLAIMNAMVGLMIILQTLLQLLDGVTLTIGEILIYGITFVTMSLFATGFTIRYLRHTSETPVQQTLKA